MSYGIKIVNSNGRVYDSSSIPAMLYEVFTIIGGSSGSKAYPELAGYTVDCAMSKTSQDAIETTSDHSVSYDLGYPVVKWAYSRGGYSNATLYLFVFAW